ncbi:MAG: hypothetical protein FWF82_00310 [Oscillospiraceae bacterium]|nr:hypothetical protein [Oscillospiraceae bacterium]
MNDIKDMTSLFSNAKKYGIFSHNQLIGIIEVIKEQKPNWKIDWDKDAGEEWITFFNADLGETCWIHTKIKIAFCSKNAFLDFLKETIYIVYVDSFSLDEWYIDIEYIKKEIPELDWRVSGKSVNPDIFSLQDLYFATV